MSVIDGFHYMLFCLEVLGSMLGIFLVLLGSMWSSNVLERRKRLK